MDSVEAECTGAYSVGQQEAPVPCYVLAHHAGVSFGLNCSRTLDSTQSGTG